MWIKNKMITYELAKKLKDAGFKVEHEYEKTCKHGQIKDVGYPIIACECGKDDWVYSPTLSELIEACGERFSSLNIGIDRMYHAWATRNNDIKHIEDIYGEGEAPEEAVANLWLKLNKKEYGISKINNR